METSVLVDGLQIDLTSSLGNVLMDLLADPGNQVSTNWVAFDDKGYTYNGDFGDYIKESIAETKKQHANGGYDQSRLEMVEHISEDPFVPGNYMYHRRWQMITESPSLSQVLSDQVIRPLSDQLSWFGAQGGGNTLTNPTGLGIRNDDGGQGHFGASRTHGTHKGLDFQSVDGQDILSPVAGRAINSYFVNKKGHKVPTVVIYPSNTNIGFNKLELLYVGPISGQSRTVEAGQVVGQSVNLQGLGYPANVTPHVHLQMKLHGVPVNPTPYFPGLMNSPQLFGQV